MQLHCAGRCDAVTHHNAQGNQAQCGRCGTWRSTEATVGDAQASMQGIAVHGFSGRVQAADPRVGKYCGNCARSTRDVPDGRYVTCAVCGWSK